ncbi:BTAD domain-containing putative transcriptional regulator [Nonomuraea sp. 10N515B]|uniref:BTAD domain-containing putative transcriptional regulator n=1 Tax=Nonomuraea sp. 10N515B TaxID=3457422 RepID=UPI003FCD1B74
MKIKLLGPLEIRDDRDMLIPVTSAKQRIILAALAFRLGEVVPVEHLVDCLWDGGPPLTARETVHSHVMRLRKLLATSQVLLTQPGGYLLNVDMCDVDTAQVQRLRARAAQAAAGMNQQGQSALLRDALALWRGEPMTGIDSEVLRAHYVRVWEDTWCQMMEECVDAELALNRHASLVGELRFLVASHPLRERFHGQLMLALNASGQRAEALRVYQEVRRVLIEELGIEPGEYLREVHRQVLNASPEPASMSPALLPLDVYGFVGRDPELERLDAILAAADEQPTAVVVTVLSGAAGVGKTALAVHWAHQVSKRFPGGQLYVNLRGFDPTGSPMSPADAMRSLLEALGVPPERVPAGLAAQTGLYRSMLTGRRVLIVLDNARDSEQVRPLLPGSPGCLVLVTSRSQLSGLVAMEGAHPLFLKLLPVSDARKLMAKRLGANRVVDEADAAEEIIRRCARLPLAIAIVASRAASNPDVSLSALVAELDDAYLDVFDGGEPMTQIRTVFSWSYHALTTDTARLFRLLGSHPGPEITAPAAASLVGMSLAQARPLLAELTRTHLLTQHAHGRYAFHDLLRAYAAELATAHEVESERQAALHRLLDHYVHTAHHSARLLNVHQNPLLLAPPQPGVVLSALTDHAQAWEWFKAEHPVLMAAVSLAAQSGFDTHLWQLAWLLNDFLDRQGRWREQAGLQELGLEAARRTGDEIGQAHAYRNLGWALTKLSRYDDALGHFQSALRLYGDLGDLTGAAHTHGNMSGVLERQGHYQEALSHAEQALDLYQRTNHQAGQARALNAVGWHYTLLGEHPKALAYCRQALDLQYLTGDLHGQAATWDSLGHIHHHLQQHEQAIDCYRQSLELFRHAGDLCSVAGTLTRLGDSHQKLGEGDTARLIWGDALQIFEELDHPDAQRVRARLVGLSDWGAVVHEHVTRSAGLPL